MATWRMLHTDMHLSEKLGRLSDAEERLFIRLIAAADDYGRMRAAPGIIQITALGTLVLSGPGRWKSDKIATILGRLEDTGLIKLYEVAGKQYLQIVKWLERQKTESRHRKRSKIPAPTQVVVSKGFAKECETVRNDAQKCATDIDLDIDIDLEVSPKGDTNAGEGVVVKKVEWEKILDSYNAVCHPAGMPLGRWSTNRKGHAGARWRDNPNIGWFEALFLRASKSSFLCGLVPGKDGRKTFRADFGWLLNEENGVKILEGKYDDGHGGSNPSGNHESGDF